MRDINLPDLPAVDLFAARAGADPYPTYRRLREKEPVHWSNGHAAWVITGYEPAVFVLSHPAVCHWSINSGTGQDNAPSRLGHLLGKWLSLLDPRAHSILRRLTLEVFTPKALQEVATQLRHLGHSLLDLAEQSGSLEVIRDFAEPLALTAITHMFGIPADRRACFFQFAHGLVGRPFAAASAASEVTRPDAAAFLEDLLVRKRHQPQPDLLTGLLQARNAGELQNDELMAFFLFFLFAGHENVMNFIGNAVFALAGHPLAFDSLRENRTVPGGAVDELLRYDSPVQFMALRACDDVPLVGKTLRGGEQILVCIGAANRDPQRFPQPNRIDFSRAHNRHLSFGHGPLTCLGASLARLEGQTALEVLAARMPRLVLSDPVAWRSHPPVLRGPVSLRLRV